jgi:hypothetical protein
LLAASQAGLLEGDPHRPYLRPVIPQGDAGQIFVAAVWSLWLTWEHVLAAYETARLARAILGRVRRGQKAARESAGTAWRHALGRPQDLLPFLDDRPRRSEAVAEFVGLPVEQVEGALWGMGYVYGEDGFWRAGADPVGEALHRTVISIEHQGRAPTQADVEVILRSQFGPDPPDKSAS